MALNDEAVRAGLTGKVYVGPVGTTLPTDVTTPLDANFQEAGLVDPDAISETFSVDKNIVRAWQRKGGVRTLTGDVEWTFQFKLLETSPLAYELYFAGDVSVNSGVAKTAVPNNPTGTEHAFVFEFEDGDVIERVVVPKGDITDRGDISHTSDDATMYELTVTVLGTTSDDLGYRYTNDPTFVAAVPSS